MDDLAVDRREAVAEVRLRRPPNNFLDAPLVALLASALEALDDDPGCRAIVLASEGRHFSAGANLAGRLADGSQPQGHIYGEAARLVQTNKPIIAAVQGAAVGAGLGLALIADFRVGCEESRFSANFARQGYHAGFGISFSLPRLVGPQHAAWLLYSGARIKGGEALAMGLLDRLVPEAELLAAAHAMAAEIAASGPLAVAATRRTLRQDFAERFAAAMQQEMAAQDALRVTADYREGVEAMAERRLPQFTGR